MTHGDAGHYGRKHAPGTVADPVIRDALLKSVVQEELPCAVAFDLANDLGVAPDAVGRTADLMELRLVKCQLGLFGYGPRKGIVSAAESVTPAIEKAIREALMNDRLPCKRAWAVAKTLGLHKMKISAACEALGIKIGPCQLGAF
jgi:hypothetical protein